MHSSIMQKSMVILDIISSSSRPMTFTDLVKKSVFTKSTTHRLLSVLSTENLVHYDKTSRTYMLGRKLLELARNARHGMDVQSLALDEMVRLNALTRENVTIGVLQGHEVVYLRVIDAEYDWGLVQRPGMKEPAHSTATGKSIVAFLPLQTRNTWIDNHDFTVLTEQTITDRNTFEAELDNIRIQEFATSGRETVNYISGIAAPILNDLGEPVAALNIWAPAFRQSLEDLMIWTDDLKMSARRVSHRLNGGGDTDEPFS